MSEIKRYNVKCNGDCLEEARDGALVDYRAHRDSVYELRQQLASCQETKNKLDVMAANEGRENAALKKAGNEMLELLVKNAPIENLWSSDIEDWDALLGNRG